MDCGVIDDEIAENDDKELCEDGRVETVTNVVNKHLAHVTHHKQVNH